VIVAYDITNGETFSHVPQWVDDVKRYAGECDGIVTWETKLWEVRGMAQLLSLWFLSEAYSLWMF